MKQAREHVCGFSEKNLNEMSEHEPCVLFGWLSSCILELLSKVFVSFLVSEMTEWLRQRCIGLRL